MRLRVWMLGLGAGLLLAQPAWAASRKAENLDFSLKVDSLSWTATGFVLKAEIENRSGSPELFLHHEAGRDDPETFSFKPGSGVERASRQTYMLKGLSQARTAATLAFGLEADQEAGLLVVGEARPPYRQVAIALKDLLPERPATQAAAAPPEERTPPAPAAPEAGVIQRFMPPHPSFGEQIVLKEGMAGPRGQGWTRIYTELPEITLDELARVLERPAQIWRGEEGYLYLRNVGGNRALAVDVRNAEVISARYVSPETLGQVLGPKTRYPKRVYMGRP